MAKKIAFLGIMTSLACIMSYVEALIPLLPRIYGIKLGLANIVVVWVLYTRGIKSAALVSIARVLTVTLLFANIAVFFYSLAGALASLAVMTMAIGSGRCSIYAVSVLGAIFHNLAQLTVAAILLGSMAVWTYLPLLFLSGIITGLVIGYLTDKIKRALKYS